MMRCRVMLMTLLLLPFAAGVVTAEPVATIATIDPPATATGVAARVRIAAAGDLVSISQVSQLSTGTIDAATAAAREAGATASLASGFSVGMISVRRGESYVQQAIGSGGLWQYPMSVTVMPVDTLRAIMGDRIASVIAGGAVVMGATTAGLRGAQVGDLIDLVSAGGTVVTFTIGGIATDAEVGGTEVVMSPEQAAAIGPLQPTRVLIHGTFARTAIEMALAARGMFDSLEFQGNRLRVRSSWGPPDPDSTIGMVRTKVLLGEFDYRVDVGLDGVSVDPEWRATRIVRVDFTDIGIRTNCNTTVVADLQAALTEVAQRGLSGAIDLANTNSAGGCYYPRFNRVTGNLGFLSRHSWGQPIDMNTVTNAQGKVPSMDCRVVRIFRKHGFAWGGNFLSRDGMHFEWVGEPRDRLQFPSAYCPNLPGGAIESLGPVATNRPTIFADDGWAGE